MKDVAHARRRAIAAAAALLLTAACGLAAGELRTWTGANGSTAEAMFVRESFGYTYLSTAEGKTIKIATSQLSEADRQYVREQKGQAAAATADSTTSRLSSRATPPPGTLSEAELAAMITRQTCDKTGKQFSFIANAEPARVADASERRKFARTGRTPFRLTVELREADPKRGGASRRLGGRCSFYILDAEGKVALKETESLDNMCPT